MLEARPIPETTSRTSARTIAALCVVLAAAVVFLVRLPSVISDFDHRATVNAHQSVLGRTIQGSDALDISNEADTVEHVIAELRRRDLLADPVGSRQRYRYAGSYAI